MSAILSLLLGFLPPLAAGPAAGIAYIEMLKRRKLQYQAAFWALLVFLDLLIMFWVASSSGTWSPIASLSAFLATPVASILTVFVMRNIWRRFESSGGIEASGKRRFTLGVVLIPALQIGMFVMLLIFVPWLCKAGLLICQG
jgi:glucose-6-phosphate-specific signal transduction histidine kinase